MLYFKLYGKTYLETPPTANTISISKNEISSPFYLYRFVDKDGDKLAMGNTFRVQVAGGTNLQGVYQRLNLRADMPVELRPARAENKIYVDFKNRGFFSTKYETLGYLTKSEDLLFQLDQGYKITDPMVAGFYNEDWGKQLILHITVVKPSLDDMIFIRSCPHCNESNLETDTICRKCQRKLDTGN